MTARGIIFSAAMAKALVAGRKTATRRLASNINAARVSQGDLLWVRENFRLEIGFDGMAPNTLLATSFTQMPVWHEADCGAPDPKYTKSPWGHPWGRLRPSIHMPLWASRLTLEVSAIRRERLDSIDDAGAFAEGIESLTDINGAVCWRGAPALKWRGTPVDAYRDLWDHLNKDPAASFAAGPEVIVIEFLVVVKNVLDVLGRRRFKPERAA